MKSLRWSLFVVVPLAIAIGRTEPARAQVVVVTVAPPAAYIATSQPEYFENRPVYWYNNNWYYRDHGRWLYYRREPDYLRERRVRWVHPQGAEWRERHEREEHREYRGSEWNRRYRYHR
jgi:hypothetical protein